MYPEHRKVCILYNRPTLFFLSVNNLILIILNGICVHEIDVLDSFYSAYDRPTFRKTLAHNSKVRFSLNSF